MTGIFSIFILGKATNSLMPSGADHQKPTPSRLIVVFIQGSCKSLEKLTDFYIAEFNLTISHFCERHRAFRSMDFRNLRSLASTDGCDICVNPYVFAGITTASHRQPVFLNHKLLIMMLINHQPLLLANVQYEH